MELLEVGRIKAERLPQRRSALPGPLLQQEHLAAPKNSLGGFMTNNFNSVMSCFVQGVETSIASRGRILCTGINDLMSKGRFFERTHPVSKEQDGPPAQPSPGAVRSSGRGPEHPARPLPGRTAPMEAQLCSGRAAGPAVLLPGPLSLPGRPCLLWAAFPRVGSAPRGRGAFSIDTLHGNLQNT